MDLNLITSNKTTQLLSNSANAVMSNSDIPANRLSQNVGIVRSSIPKTRSVNLTDNMSNTYGATVLSNRTNRRGAIDNIKLKHQQMFGTGADSKRRNNPLVIN
jgi:hypothetical protein